MDNAEQIITRYVNLLAEATHKMIVAEAELSRLKAAAAESDAE